MLADNLIFDQMQVLADGGAIYSNGLTGSSLANGEQIIRIPTTDGGSPIIAYTISVVGGATITVTGQAILTLSGTHTYYGVLEGLTSRDSYTLQVAAVNVAGQSSPVVVTVKPT